MRRPVGGVGFLSFEFYNGAMGSAHCRRLTQAFRWASTRPTRVIVLRGGEDFWSNGIHLNLIEAAESPADASWENINAIDDLAEAILRCETQLTVAAVGGNTGAGGCFLARACDQVWVRDGVMLNPHYKNMGNLFGSEFWTYLLPPRVGDEGAAAIMRRRLPMSAGEAVNKGFYDACLPAPGFTVDVARRAAEMAASADFSQQLAAKVAQRAADEAIKPLAATEFAGTRCLNRGIEGKNIGLEGDSVNHADDIVDPARTALDLGHRTDHPLDHRTALSRNGIGTPGQFSSLTGATRSAACFACVGISLSPPPRLIVRGLTFV